MAKREYGTQLNDDDVLVIQGHEYPLQPYGMRAFRETTVRTKQIAEVRAMDKDDTDRTAAIYDVSIETVVNAVKPEHREALREHIENSVPPSMLAQIAGDVMRGWSDVDPTQPTSSSDGSSETGQGSTDGASAEASTPST